MSDSLHNLRPIAQLAYLETDEAEITRLTDEINSILDFVQQLRQVNTTNVPPLFHPVNYPHLHAALRNDDVSEESCLQELEELAPHFDAPFYLVPKVIDSGK